MKFIKKDFTIEICVIAIAIIPLLVFSSHQYSGDGIVYSNYILKNQYIWNPNHLLMQPIGLVFYNLLHSINLSIHPLDAQRIIAIISAIISVLIFWIALKKYILPHKWYSAIFVIAFFYSNYFLALSDSSEFFMIQMPFLMGIFFISCWVIQKNINNGLNKRETILIGLLLGWLNTLATLSFISNIFLIIGLLFVFILIPTKGLFRYRALQLGVIMLLSSSLLIGCAFYITWNFFVKSGTNIYFLKWLISYGGSGEIQIGTYGSFSLNITDILIRTLRIAFSFLQNIAHTELGSIIQSKLTGAPLDCTGFKLIQLLWWFFIFFMIGVMFFLVLVLVTKNIFKNKNSPYCGTIIFLTIWILSFLPFNFYWNNSDDQFWFQITPAFWSFLSLPVSMFCHKKNVFKKALFISSMIIFVLVIIINNILYSVLPRHQFDTKNLSYKLSEHLSNNSFLIWPGNDRWGPVIYFAENYKREKGDSFKTLSVVSFAGKGGNPVSISQAIQDILSRGQRVFLLRIIEPDDECVPWGELRQMGWDRNSMVSTLNNEFHFGKVKRIYNSTSLIEVTMTKRD